MNKPIILLYGDHSQVEGWIWDAGLHDKQVMLPKYQDDLRGLNLREHEIVIHPSFWKDMNQTKERMVNFLLTRIR